MHPLLSPLNLSDLSTNAHGPKAPTKHGNYPTREEILKGLHTPTQNELKAVQRWKNVYYKGWFETTPHYKLERIGVLLAELCITRNTSVTFAEGTRWAYYPGLHTITSDTQAPSIISALHELGHHFYGSSELKACQYSVGMFKTCFPAAFAKLVWDGHKLVKPKSP